MTFLFTNNAATTLSTSYGTGATSMVVATGGGATFPTPSGASVFRAAIVRASDSAIEIVEVTARSTDTMTVTRAQEGTTALAFVAGDKFEKRLTAAELSAFSQGGGTTWAIKTANYTAVSGDAILANTTGGSFTLTLPATPSAGDKVQLADYNGSLGTNKLTVGRNGSNINGLAEDMDITSPWLPSTVFTYINSTVGWRTL